MEWCFALSAKRTRGAKIFLIVQMAICRDGYVYSCCRQRYGHNIYHFVQSSFTKKLFLCCHEDFKANSRSFIYHSLNFFLSKGNEL